MAGNYFSFAPGGGQLFFDDAAEDGREFALHAVRGFYEQHPEGLASVARACALPDLQLAHVVGQNVLVAENGTLASRLFCIGACKRQIGEGRRYYAVPGGLVHVGCGP